jgi:hypothetical protein
MEEAFQVGTHLPECRRDTLAVAVKHTVGQSQEVVLPQRWDCREKEQ